MEVNLNQESLRVKARNQTTLVRQMMEFHGESAIKQKFTLTATKNSFPLSLT
jgi:hypothetical protein